MTQNLGNRWQYPVLLGLWPLYYAAVAVGYLVIYNVLGDIPPLVEELAAPFLITMMGLFILFSVLALVGFYSDSNELYQKEADWQPSWLTYFIGSWFLTPPLVATIYTIQRWRHLGIPWRELHPRHW